MPIELTIVADDFGMSALYDRGIVEAADAGAIDGAGVMVRRGPGRIRELVASGVDVGLHLEGSGEGELLDEAELRAQLGEFERLAGRPPDYLDGHHNCHAGRAAGLVAALAVEHGFPVRSIDAEHRRLLRGAGVSTPDLLVGRYEESDPPVPPELADPPAGITSMEWMVHPGHPDPAAGSDYDAGRAEDLETVLSVALPPGLARVRRSRSGPEPWPPAR